MKKKIAIILLLLIPSIIFCQKMQFEWNDSTFEVGAKRYINLQFDYDGPCSVKPCYRTLENAATYDTLLAFFQKNPTLKIEFGFHTDTRGAQEYNKEVSTWNSDGLAKELKYLGFNPDRYITKGYGASQPIYFEEKDAQKNKRIEVIILEK